MSTKLKIVVMAAVLGMGLMTPALPSTASTPSGDWVSVDQVLVNKLGGVNVSGQVSCAGTYDRIVAGLFQVQDQDGNWFTLALSPGDKVNLAANNDNYTVSQPSGRKTMIQVTHGSSRMNPCFIQVRTDLDGSEMPSWVICAEGGAPCRWATDEFGYDPSTLVPLFDYSPDGKFKTGLLSVQNRSIGLLVMVQHADQSWDTYYVSEGMYAVTNTTIRAVSYR